MKKKAVAKNVKAYVSKRGTGVDVVEELLGNLIKRADGEPLAEISVELSRTVNLGNYNSVRIGVGITVPCQISKIDGSYRSAMMWTNSRMEEEVAKVRDLGVA